MKNRSHMHNFDFTSLKRSVGAFPRQAGFTVSASPAGSHQLWGALTHFTSCSGMSKPLAVTGFPFLFRGEFFFLKFFPAAKWTAWLRCLFLFNPRAFACKHGLHLLCFAALEQQIALPEKVLRHWAPKCFINVCCLPITKGQATWQSVISLYSVLH